MSSSEEEDDILSLISGKPVPKTTSTSYLRNSTPTTSAQVDEFALNLPPVFEADAKRDAEVFAKQLQTEKEIRHDELVLKHKYDQLMSDRTMILEELNDNGSRGEKTYSLDRDRKLIEQLLLQWKSANDDSIFSIPRHFFFLTNTYHIPTSISESHCFLWRLSQLTKRISSDVAGFVNNVLLLVHNTNELAQIRLKVESCDLTTVSMPPLGQFFKHFAEHVTIDSMPMKIAQFTNHSLLGIRRAALILVLASRCGTRDVVELIDYLLLTVLDFNLNQHHYDDLLDLVRVVVPIFARDQSIASCFYTRLRRIHPYVIAHPHNGRKAHYEIVYNILHIMHLAASTCDDAVAVQFVDGLHLQFVNDQEPDVPGDNTESSLKSLVNSESDSRGPFEGDKTSFEDGNGSKGGHSLSNSATNKKSSEFESNAPEKNTQAPGRAKSIEASPLLIPALNPREVIGMIDQSIRRNNPNKMTTVRRVNRFYYDYFRICLLNFIVVPGRLAESSRKDYIERLKELVNSVHDLKNRVHDSVRLLGYSDIANSPVFNKDDIVRHATDNFHMLAFLYNRLSSELHLVNDDIFYE